jgi:two-component system LytT family response regulator
MEIRALVIDDEPPARSRIIKLLKNFESIIVIGECSDGLHALQKIESENPDLIFLDIQMPGLNGFDVLNQLSDEFQPFIVFTTAYEQYALEAFAHQAMDYLLKPIDKNRFNQSVEKVITQIKGQSATSFGSKVKELLGEYKKSTPAEKKSFVIKQHGLLKVIRADEIFWIESEGNYVNLHCYQGNFLYRSSMSQMTDELENIQFLRIHRGLLINTLHLKKTQYLNNETFKFTFKSDSSMISGRGFKKQIQNFLTSATHIKQF